MSSEFVVDNDLKVDHEVKVDHELIVDHEVLLDSDYQVLANATDWRNQLNSELFKDYPDSLLMVAFCSCVLFMLCGLPGNIITICALIRCKKVRNTTAIFIINLSVSDLLFGCFNLPLAASVFLTRRWIWGPTLCRLFPLLRYGLVAVSTFNILAITINRYVMIAHPTIYPRVYSSHWLPLHVAGTWLGGFGSLMPTLLSSWGQFGLDPSIGSCTILPDQAGRSPKQFLFLFTFFSPSIAIVLCYARIFLIAHRASRKSTGGGKSFPSKVAVQAAAIAPQHDLQQSLEGSKVLLKPPANLDTTEYSSTNPSSSLNSSSQYSSSSVQISVHSNTTAITQVSRISLQKSDSNSSLNPVPPNSPYLASDLPHLTSEFPYLPPNSPHMTPTSPQMSPHCQQSTLNLRSCLSPHPQDGISRNKKSNASFLLKVPGTLRRSSFAGPCALIRDRTRRKSLRPGKMTAKDKRLLKMILVIFVSFLFCYLPITIDKILRDQSLQLLVVTGYMMMYLTTCINPIIYVFMSSEYRQAYKSLLTCQPSRSFRNPGDSI